MEGAGSACEETGEVGSGLPCAARRVDPAAAAFVRRPVVAEAGGGAAREGAAAEGDHLSAWKPDGAEGGRAQAQPAVEFDHVPDTPAKGGLDVVGREHGLRSGRGLARARPAPPPAPPVPPP